MSYHVTIENPDTPNFRFIIGLPPPKVKEILENDSSAINLARAIVAKYEVINKETYRHIGGHKMFLDFESPDPSMRGIYHDYALHGEYEPHTTKLIESNVKEGDVCLDVGASVGYFTLLLARKAKKVYAIEATKNQIPTLKKNIEVNGYTNVEIINKGAWDKEEIISVNGNAVGRDNIEAIALDSVIKEPIDFIKMDIDGSEPKALKGMEELIKNSPNLKMVIEYYPKYIERLGLNPKDMTDFLDKYFIYSRIEGEYSDECYNLYCERK